MLMIANTDGLNIIIYENNNIDEYKTELNITTTDNRYNCSPFEEYAVLDKDDYEFDEYIDLSAIVNDRYGYPYIMHLLEEIDMFSKKDRMTIIKAVHEFNPCDVTNFNMESFIESIQDEFQPLNYSDSDGSDIDIVEESIDYISDFDLDAMADAIKSELLDIESIDYISDFDLDAMAAAVKSELLDVELDLDYEKLYF